MAAFTKAFRPRPFFPMTVCYSVRLLLRQIKSQQRGARRERTLAYTSLLKLRWLLCTCVEMNTIPTCRVLSFKCTLSLNQCALAGRAGLLPGSEVLHMLSSVSMHLVSEYPELGMQGAAGQSTRPALHALRCACMAKQR